MRVLVTGSRGLVGRATVHHLQSNGDEVLEYDRVDGRDVLDSNLLTECAAAAEVIVHLAALDDPPEAGVSGEIPRPGQGTPEQVLAVSILGTLNVLEAARTAGHGRVVVMSSAAALGVFGGQRAPDYLPLDGDHPTYPGTPYSLAKRTAERICADFAARTGVSTICLRPPGIWDEMMFALIRKRFAEDPTNDRKPFWEYGAFIALSDVVAAIRCAVHRPFEGQATLLIAADDAALAVQSSFDAARTIHPEVPWRGGSEFHDDPFHTLVDNRDAKSVLDWSPRRRFREDDSTSIRGRAG